jgi:hypothetical protein
VPPTDAPHYVCDPLPAFIMLPKSFLPGCTDYTTDSHHDKIGVAFCSGGGGNGGVIQKGLPGSMEMRPIDFNNDASIKEVPRLGPAGDNMIVRSRDNSVPGDVVFKVFVEAADGHWLEDKGQAIAFTTAFTVSTMDTISTPTAGAIDRHVVLHHLDGTGHETFVEFAETHFAGWTLQHMYVPGDLGVLTFADPYLSEDGLALWFVGTDTPNLPPGIFASIRATNGDLFSQATKVTTPPQSSLLAPFVTRDCSRLYFGVGSDTSFVVH